MTRRARKRESGQAAVETAIIMPLFVFLVLGLLQLALLHQARLLAKYAAYKAVRVGSIHNAKMESMKRAAMAVMLPMMGRQTTWSFFNATPAKFSQSWAKAEGQLTSPEKYPPLEVTICDPVGNVSGDFDDPYSGMAQTGDWQQDMKGRLSIQLQVNYQLVIPFANGVIWHLVRGTERAELLRNLRLAGANDQYQAAVRNQKAAQSGMGRSVEDFANLVTDDKSSIYVLPIRTGWSMRMQSNFLNKQGFKLPGKNKCRIPWAAPQ